MKDPLDHNRRAYEVLGVGRDATPDEINKAYARLAADPKNVMRRQELTNAWQRLRRPETRLEEDFWYYDVGDAEKAEPGPADTREGFPWDPALPPIVLGPEVTDLAGDRCGRDFGPLAFRELTLTHLERYDEAPAAVLPLTFER
jgi:hypothetical protein